MWRGGCIIRSQFLSKIKDAYDKNPGLTNLLLDEFFSSTLLNYQASWRRGIIAAIQAGCRLRRSRLPSHSSMDSALRVCRRIFCRPSATTSAHTPTSVSTNRAAIFHSNWTGKGGRVSSGSYNA